MNTSKVTALALAGLLSAVSLGSFAASDPSTGKTDPIGSPPNPATQESKDSMGTGLDTNGGASSRTVPTHAPKAMTATARAWVPMWRTARSAPARTPLRAATMTTCPAHRNNLDPLTDRRTLPHH